MLANVCVAHAHVALNAVCRKQGRVVRGGGRRAASSIGPCFEEEEEDERRGEQKQDAAPDADDEPIEHTKIEPETSECVTEQQEERIRRNESRGK